MKKAQDLKTYLQNWKRHYLCDVEGQQAGEHLSDEELAQVIHGTAEERLLDHLASCPSCLERWSAQLGEEREPASVFRPLSYGQQQEDDDDNDVMGQSSQRDLISHCGCFTLHVTAVDAEWHVTLSVKDASLDGHHLQVRTKEGNILLDGMVQNRQLDRSGVCCDDHDFSLWSVMVR
ncbi:MAG: hypothetical protein C0620_09000 [Desulfuromonas sp.]|nr:MAG: hypothetical protein C0620_09000 [Desulfuromonas sp.]